MIEENSLVKTQAENAMLSARAASNVRTLEEMTASGMFNEDSDEQLTTTLEVKKEIGRRRQWWLDLIGPAVKAAHESWKKSVATRDEIDKPLADAETKLGLAAGRYKDARDLARRREEERLRQIEIKKQEDERRRQAEIAEAQAKKDREEQARKQAEADRLAAQGRAEAAAEARAKAEQARQSAEANTTVMEEAITAPINVAPVKLADAPKVEDTVDRRTWKFRIVNAALVPREFLIPDEKLIGAQARLMKDKTSIPGVEVWGERKVS